ncbi:MAG: GNAT family acetyltransferase [Candidatus Zixiibacteriota bacterium]
MKIRLYQTKDSSQVAELWKIVFPSAPAHNRPEDDIRRKEQIQKELFFVAEIDKRIIGTALSGYDGHRGWVYYVAVHPDFRRQHIGEKLMLRVEQELKNIGCPKLNLQVRADNKIVIDFYKKLDYEIEERVSMGKKLV